MRVAHLAGPMHIELVEVPPPRVPDDGILLAVRACGVCGRTCGAGAKAPMPAAGS